jgi:hypothetical protein
MSDSGKSSGSYDPLVFWVSASCHSLCLVVGRLSREHGDRRQPGLFMDDGGVGMAQSLDRVCPRYRQPRADDRQAWLAQAGPSNG